VASEGCENAANARVGSGDLKTIVLWPVVAGFLLVSGCSSGEMTTADGEAGTSVGQEATPSENSDAEFAEPCDPSAPHPKGAFEFAPQVDESLPQQWRTEFGVILANLQQVAPISQCIHDSRDPDTGELSVRSPMSIYAWNSAVENPWSDERPGMGGASISGDGFDTWMVLEIPQDEFEYDPLHRYSVVAHEYWHVYQRGAWDAQGVSWPDWMWEGGAKVVEELYIAEHYGRSEFDQNLRPVIATALSNPADFERYESDGGAVGGESDINYNTSAFMVLALAAELQDTLNISEEEAFGLVLTAPAAPGSETPFLDVFGMTREEFYSSLAQYPATESGEDWFEGDVVDASDVMPSNDLTLERILESSP